MTRYLISYDLKKTNPQPYEEVLEQAAKVGWTVWIFAPNKNKWYRLPNTTLVGEFDNRDAAKKAFDTAIQGAAKSLGISITVEKYFLADYSGAQFDSDVSQNA